MYIHLINFGTKSSVCACVVISARIAIPFKGSFALIYYLRWPPGETVRVVHSTLYYPKAPANFNSSPRMDQIQALLLKLRKAAA